MLEHLLKPEIQELIRDHDLTALRRVLSDWEAPDIAGLIDALPRKDDVVVFRLLASDLATEVFEHLSRETQHELVESMAQEQERLSRLLNDIAPDDRTALLEELPGPVAQRLLTLLSPQERKIAIDLLGYPEDSIGRLMTTDYVAVRPEWTIEEALAHIRRFGQDSETLNVIYIVDENWRLIDDLRVRELLLAPVDAAISHLMDNRFIALHAGEDQETAFELFRKYDRVALPVTDSQGVLIGIVTVDDVLDVVEQETTEDIQKIGGSAALEEPYLTIPLLRMVRKRALWLVLLFFGQMLTATAMVYFDDALQQALILAVFIPLIISSGGNSGSQAATLIIRALTTGEVRLRDWWRVTRREVAAGTIIGVLLGGLGFLRIAAGEWMYASYGPYWMQIGLTICISLTGVVLWGTLSGSLLPILLRRLGADPAASSTPFVATLVDVTGLIIYFTVAATVLSGTLL